MILALVRLPLLASPLTPDWAALDTPASSQFGIDQNQLRQALPRQPGRPLHQQPHLVLELLSLGHRLPPAPRVGRVQDEEAQGEPHQEAANVGEVVEAGQRAGEEEEEGDEDDGGKNGEKLENGPPAQVL